MRQYSLPISKIAAMARTFFACVAGTAIFLTATVDETRAAETVLWNLGTSGTWDTTSPNWVSSSSMFASGDAVVFGLTPSNTTANAGVTVNIINAGVTIGAQPYTTGTVTGTNPGMIIGSGTWAFTGGGITGGGIQIKGDSAASFTNEAGFTGRSFSNQRITVDDNVDFILAVSETSSYWFTSTGIGTESGGAIRTGTGSNLNLTILPTTGTSASGRMLFVSNTTSANGGAIYAGGNLKLSTPNATGTMTFSGNTSGTKGGAIYTEGNLTVSGSGLNVQFSNNRATDAASTAIYVGGTLILENNAKLGFENDASVSAEAYKFSNATLQLVQNTSTTGLVTLNTLDATGAVVGGTGKIFFDNVTLQTQFSTLSVTAGSDINITGTLTVFTTATTLSPYTNIAAPLSGSGALLKTGTMALHLSGSNTYAGPTTVAAGLLSGNIANNTALTINAGATYQSGSSAGIDRALATLNGAGTIDMKGASINVSAGDFTSGTFRNTSTITKSGTGTFTIGTGSSTNIVINQGKLDIGSDKVFTVIGTTTIAPTGTLGVNVSDAPALVTGRLDAVGGNIDITGYGNISQFSTTGTHVLILAHNAIASGYNLKLNGLDLIATPVDDSQFLAFTDISSGTQIAVSTALVWNNTAPRSAHGTFNVTSGTFTLNTNLANNTTSGTGAVGWDGTTLTKKGAGTLVLNGTNTYTGVTTGSQGLLVNQGFITGAVNVAPTGAVLNTGTIRGDITNAGYFAFQSSVETTSTTGTSWTPNIPVETTGTTIYSSIPTGNGFIASTTIISSTNVITYSGTVSGTAVIGGTTGYKFTTVITSQVANGFINNFTNTGTAIFNLSADYNHTGTLSGNAGLIVKTGTSTFTLNGANTYSGTVQIAQGTIKAGKANILDSVDRYLIGATLDLDEKNQNLKNVENYGLIRLGPLATATTALTTATLGMQTYTGTGYMLVRSDYNAHRADLITISGSTSGEHTILISNKDDVTPIKTLKSIPLIIVSSDTNVATATFSGSAEVGIGILTVHREEPGSSLSPASGDPAKTIWYLAATDQLSNTADAILATASVTGLEWHYQLDSVRQRMGDLRQEALMAPPEKRQSPLAYTTVTSAGGNAWLRGSAYHLEGDNTITGDAFDENVAGINFGYDKTYRWETNQYLLGAFGNIGNVRRNFETRGDGKTNTYGAGLYFSYLNDNGWYGDSTLKINSNKNSITAKSIDDMVNTAEYRTMAWGISLEVGRVLKNKRTGWWWEPSAQAALAILGGKNYSTSNNIDVEMDSANVTQYRASIRVGRDIPRSSIKPYVKAAIVSMQTSGGRMRAGSTYFTPDMDGSRVEAGAGLSYIFDEKSQLYMDYEYAKSSAYERPWSVNFGYRCTW